MRDRQKGGARQIQGLGFRMWVLGFGVSGFWEFGDSCLVLSVWCVVLIVQCFVLRISGQHLAAKGEADHLPDVGVFDLVFRV